MREDTIESANIKVWLDAGPKIPLTDKPLFRLVWSEDAKELRTGTYSKWVAGVKIREWQATEEVLKYNWLSERWLIEQWFPPKVALNSELPESVHGSYECLYAFEDSKGNELPLNLEVTMFVVQQALKPKVSAALRASISRNIIEERERIAMSRDLDILNDESALVSQLHDGSAILRP